MKLVIRLSATLCKPVNRFKANCLAAGALSIVFEKTHSSWDTKILPPFPSTLILPGATDSPLSSTSGFLKSQVLHQSSADLLLMIRSKF